MKSRLMLSAFAAMGMGVPRCFQPPPFYQAPEFKSGVVIPPHDDAAAIEKARLKQLRKANRRKT